LSYEHHGPDRGRTPGLPPAGWLPDPAVTELERYWDGARWTRRTRNRHTRIETGVMSTLVAEPPRREQRVRRAGRAHWGRRFVIALAVIIVGVYAYQWALAGSYLPYWATPAGIRAASGPPQAPDVDYATFGSTELVTYLEASMIAQEERIDVTYWAPGGDVNDVRDAFSEAASQSPYLYVAGFRYASSPSTVWLEPDYAYDAAEAERRRVETSIAAERAASTSGALSATSDADKAARIHDFIVSTAEYDYAAYETMGAEGTVTPRVQQSQEAYGILVAGTAVCNGYAHAFQAIAQKAGLETVVVNGTVSQGMTIGHHAWNQVQVDGEWLVVDATWDDPGGDAGTRTDYLLIDPASPLLETRFTGYDWIVDFNRDNFGV